MIQTFIPAPSNIGRNARYWKSPSTEQLFRNPADFNDLELDSLRVFDAELLHDIATLKEQKKQISRKHAADQDPLKAYVHDLSRIENRRRFLLRLRTSVECAIKTHPDRVEKAFVHSLQAACKELLTKEQYREVMHLATEKYERIKAKS